MKLKSQAGRYVLLPLLLLISANSYALPLNLTLPAGTALPTTVANGGLDFAYYTVQNNTPDVRSGVFVKWLPPNVTQNTSSAANCPASMTLQPKGSAGDSCMLKLNVRGSTALNASQPINHQLLLVCFPGGKTCTGPNPQIQLNVTQASTSPIAVAVGHYKTTAGANNTFDLAMSSQDGATTWASRITSSNIGSGLPANLSLTTADHGAYNYFYQPRCTGNSCIAVGTYENAAGYFPTISQSQNGGVTWTSVVGSTNVGTGLPADIVAGPSADQAPSSAYIAASCAGTTCAAAGSYLNPANLAGSQSGIALLSVSQDSGAHWTSKLDASSIGTSLPADLDPTNYSVFGDVSCQQNYCVAAGQYYTTATGAPGYPLITVSQNNGSTWTTKVSSATPASLPPDFSGPAEGVGYQTRVSCTGSVCAMASGYVSTAAGSPNYNMILVSQNSGSTWTSAVDSRSIGTPALPSDFSPAGGGNSYFWSVGCSGSNCIAGGRYLSSTTGNWTPLLVSSQNGGTTWTSTIDTSKIGTVLPSNIKCPSRFSALLSSSCSGDLCVTVGHYQDTSNNRYPILLVSQDGGITWSRKIDASSVGTLLPNMLLQNTGSFPYTDNTLYGVSCTDSFCFAIGSYVTPGGVLTPLLIVSQNKGATWTVAVSGNIVTSLPSDFFNGTLGAGSAQGFGIQGGGTSLTMSTLSDKAKLRYSASTVLENIFQG